MEKVTSHPQITFEDNSVLFRKVHFLELVLVVFLLLFPAIAAGAYFLGQKTAAPAKELSKTFNYAPTPDFAAMAEADRQEQEVYKQKQEAAQQLLTTPLAGEVVTDVVPAPQNWLTYEDYGRGITFEYPPHLLPLPDDRGTLLVNPQTRRLSNGYPVPLLEISNEFAPPTYDSVDNPKEKVTEKLAPVAILGAMYPFSLYSMGEGQACGSGSIQTYTIRLSTFNVLIYDEKSISSCDESGEVLSENLWKKMQTKPSDLEYARQILETIRPLNP